HEHVPAAPVDGPARVRTESFEKKILISGATTLRARQMREGDAAAREVHVGAELFEKVRAEEEVDFEFALAGDNEAHLFIRHDRDRDIFESDVAERDRVEKTELYRDRLAEKAEECSFELTEFTNRQLGCEMLGCDRQHCAGIDH